MFLSISLSRKRTTFPAVSLRKSQLIFPSLTKRERFMLPRLQDSKGRSGSSPHGFVEDILPSYGVKLSLFIRS